MEELLQRLVENELLNEETKQELLEAYTKQRDEAIEKAVHEAREEAEETVRAELTEQFVEDKRALIEALDTKTEEALQEQLGELKDDIESFRDLEAEYAEKYVEAKQELSDVLKDDIEELVEAIDSFLDMRIDEEMQELKEDISEVKELQFGKEVFEAFEGMFSRKFVNENGLEAELKEREKRLADLEEQLEESTRELDKANREKKLDEVLSSLHGKNKEVMEAVLKTVPTNKLEEAYERYIPKILHENFVESEKEQDDKSEVLAEGKDVNKKAKADKLTEGTVVASGDTEEQLNEADGNAELPEHVRETLTKLRKYSGIA